MTTFQATNTFLRTLLHSLNHYKTERVLIYLSLTTKAHSLPFRIPHTVFAARALANKWAFLIPNHPNFVGRPRKKMFLAATFTF